LLSPDDVAWLVEQLLKEQRQEHKPLWADVIHHLFDYNRQDHVEIVYHALGKSSLLQEKFKAQFGSVGLNSKEAQDMRADYQRGKEFEKERRRREEARNRPIQPPPAERIARWLHEFEHGNLDAWWHLCMEMTLEPTSKRYERELESDLASLPGWLNSDETTRRRIIRAAKRYILERNAAPQEWLGKDLLHRSATAGYKALLLLYKIDPDFVASLSADVWSAWAPILVGYPEPIGVAGQDESYIHLIEIAYKNAPEQVLSTLMVLIDRENEQHDTLFVLDKMKLCWDDRLCAAILDKCSDERLKPGCFGQLLSELILHDCQEARSYAEELLEIPLRSEEDKRERAKAAALALLTQGSDAGWSVVWRAIRADNKFGSNVLMALPRKIELRGSKNLVDRIGEENTADLFIWLTHLFPKSEDPEQLGAHYAGPREDIAAYRDSLLERLKLMGTPEAVRAIERIRQQLPQLNYLDFVLVTARRSVQMRSWTPLFPADFIRLAQNADARIVLTSDELMGALIESLMRLEKRLHRETPERRFLWNEISENAYEPKSENDLTDFVVIRLRDDLERSGVVAAREVEVARRQGKGGSPGERTDIYVDCFVPSRNKHVRVIIEVKGCWSPDVETAMRDQLANRYLRDKEYHHGIYLVGWFDCPQWDSSSHGGRHTPKSSPTLEQARDFFANQAKELSQGECVIQAFVLNCALR
ncbi:MAG: hypothetical protein JW884_13955, partial [Deltaproteobacteria bacterium]|nr:hypothetical protein [Deltaproteobacteria bacterium]